MDYQNGKVVKEGYMQEMRGGNLLINICLTMGELTSLFMKLMHLQCLVKST